MTGANVIRAAESALLHAQGLLQAAEILVQVAGGQAILPRQAAVGQTIAQAARGAPEKELGIKLVQRRKLRAGLLDAEAGVRQRHKTLVNPEGTFWGRTETRRRAREALALVGLPELLRAIVQRDDALSHFARVNRELRQALDGRESEYHRAEAALDELARVRGE